MEWTTATIDCREGDFMGALLTLTTPFVNSLINAGRESCLLQGVAI